MKAKRLAQKASGPVQVKRAGHPWNPVFCFTHVSNSCRANHLAKEKSHRPLCFLKFSSAFTFNWHGKFHKDFLWRCSRVEQNHWTFPFLISSLRPQESCMRSTNYTLESKPHTIQTKAGWMNWNSPSLQVGVWHWNLPSPMCNPLSHQPDPTPVSLTRWRHSNKNSSEHIQWVWISESILSESRVNGILTTVIFLSWDEKQLYSLRTSLQIRKEAVSLDSRRLSITIWSMPTQITHALNIYRKWACNCN